MNCDLLGEGDWNSNFANNPQERKGGTLCFGQQ